MRKRAIFFLALFLVAAMIAAGICGILSWRKETAGEIVITEGIRENTRITIENIYVKDGFLYYTVVNDSRFSLRFDLIPEVQKKRGEEWIHTSFWYGERENFAWESCEPFASVEKCFELKRPENAEPGEYRLVIGDYRTGHRAPPPEDYFYVVGYFTISEPTAE
jgi:hypothetical protein